MIKFFRKIRQKTLTENKFSKYLLYAIGEIILVVFGILIALQLNNYNDNLKQQKQEHKILQNLKLDFEYNLSEMERSIQQLKNNKKAGLKIIAQTGNKISNNADIDGLIDQIVFTPVYFPQNGFLLELVSSGKLGIISNEILRNRLSSWFSILENLHDREQISLEYNRYLTLYIIKNGSWLNADKVSTDEQVREIGFPESGFEIDNNEMLKLPEFENFVENQVINQTISLGRQESCLKLNREIIKLLELEIKK